MEEVEKKTLIVSYKAIALDAVEIAKEWMFVSKWNK